MSVFATVLLLAFGAIGTVYGSGGQKVFTIAVDPDYTPFTFRDTDGKANGLLVDIWRLWAKENNYSVTFKFYDWQETLEATRKGEVDFHSGTTPDYDWMYASDPIYEIESGFFAKHDLRISKKEDIFGKKIGVIDTYYGEMVKRLCQERCEVLSYPTYDALIRAVQDGKIDIMMDDVDALTYYFIRHRLLPKFYRIDAVNVVRNTELVSAVTNEQNKALLKLINAGLEALSAQELIEIEKRWLPTKKEGFYYKKFSAGTPSYGYLLMLSAALAFLVLIWYLYRLKRLHRLAKREAMIDPLTGLYNKGAFMQIEHIKQNYFAMFFIDIDKFKCYNDLYGHAKGDKALASVASILVQLQSDQVHAYRVGGDEFVLAVYDMPYEEVHALGKRIVQSVRELRIEHNECEKNFLTVTVGGVWTDFFTSREKVEVYYQCADIALYKAKQRGRDNFLLLKYAQEKACQGTSDKAHS